MIPRSKKLYNGINKQQNWDKLGLLTDTYLNHLKKFCYQCLVSLKIENECDYNTDEVKTDCIEKLVYSPESDVIYVYMNDIFSARLLMETLNQWLICTDPLYKGTTIDISEKGICTIELNYQDFSVIKHNKENKVKAIIVWFNF